MPETSQDFLRRHLENAIAAERTLEDLLSRLSKEGAQDEPKKLFQDLSAKARTQHQRLTERLTALGGSPSTIKSVGAHLVGFMPLMGQTGQNDEEKSTQHLIMAFAAAASEIAMYETLAATAAAAGDSRTEQLARQLQSEEKQDHESCWNLLGSSALHSFQSALGR